MQYLWGTREPGYHPSWWVDSSYIVHLDMRSHSGIFMTLGNGATTSSKQELSTKNSMEAELVAIDDLMVQVNIMLKD